PSAWMDAGRPRRQAWFPPHGGAAAAPPGGWRPRLPFPGRPGRHPPSARVPALGGPGAPDPDDPQAVGPVGVLESGHVVQGSAGHVNTARSVRGPASPFIARMRGIPRPDYTGGLRRVCPNGPTAPGPT